MSTEIPLRAGQFTLTRMFVVMAVIGVFLGVARLGMGGFLTGVAFFSSVVLLWGYWRNDSFAMTMSVLGVLGPFVLWSARCGHEDRFRSQNIDNMKQILLALHHYESVHRSLPPAYVADANGRPMHSWRVLLLPYLEQDALYKKYKFDEPWDGPNNRKLHDAIVHPYNPVECDREGNSMTGFVAITGPGTAWPGTRATRFADIRDGLSNTILLVEARNSGIHWMEPRDLHVAQMAPRINPLSGQGPSGHRPGRGAILGIGDGSVRYVPEDELTPAQLRALITANGGDGFSWPQDR